MHLYIYIYTCETALIQLSLCGLLQEWLGLLVWVVALLKARYASQIIIPQGLHFCYQEAVDGECLRLSLESKSFYPGSMHQILPFFDAFRFFRHTFMNWKGAQAIPTPPSLWPATSAMYTTVTTIFYSHFLKLFKQKRGWCCSSKPTREEARSNWPWRRSTSLFQERMARSQKWMTSHSLFNDCLIGKSPACWFWMQEP